MRQMAHALARHVAGLALPPVSSEEGFEQVDDETPLERDRRRARLVHLQNEDGALTWKEGCDGTSRGPLSESSSDEGR
jgi:hypothetical protein